MERLEYNPNLLNTQGAPAPTTVSTPVQIPMLSPQHTPTDSTDMVNQAVAAGIKQGQKENTVQQIDNMANEVVNQVQQSAPYWGLTQEQAYDLGNKAVERRLYKSIVDGTQNYMNAQAAGDTAGMQYWHDYTDARRAAAEKRGVDVSQYGADRSLAQKQAALDLTNDDYYAEILNTKDSGTFYNERFNYYKDMGMSDRGADKRAYADAQEYRTKRLRTLQDELLANAINPRTGAMNNYGVQLIGLMRDEDPDSITPFVTMMPGPNQDYVVRMSEYQKNNAFDRSLQAANNEFEHKRDLQHDTIEAQLRKAAMDNETKRYIAGLPTAGKGGSPQALTGLKKKGYDATQQILSTLSNIWSDPEYVATHKDDHRLKTCIDIANKALNEGAIDQTQHKNLMYKIRAAMGAVYGDANVDEWIKNWEKEHPDDELDKK
jgi:hypothetical protein